MAQQLAFMGTEGQVEEPLFQLKHVGADDSGREVVC